MQICKEIANFLSQEVDFFGGAGEGGVEPTEVLAVEHVVGEVAIVDEDILPLSALRLVAGDGVGEFYLQCVEILVVAQLLVHLAL